MYEFPLQTGDFPMLNLEMNMDVSGFIVICPIKIAASTWAMPQHPLR